MDVAVVEIALAAMPIPTLLAMIFLWRLYRGIMPRSWIVRKFAMSATVVFCASVYIAALAISALVATFELPDWTIFGLGVALLALCLYPAVVAVEFAHRQGLSIRDVVHILLWGKS